MDEVDTRPDGDVTSGSTAGAGGAIPGQARAVDRRMGDDAAAALAEQPPAPPTGRAGPGRLRGPALLASPLWNRGTAFSEEQRRAFGLVGLLPTAVSSIEGQVRRVYSEYLRQPDDLARHLFLAALRARNEVLFYRVLTDHLEEMMPVIYTPTIGRAIQQWSHTFRRPRGLFLSVDRPHDVAESFANFGLGPDDVDLVVVTDGEGILGIGDWGIGGIDIAVGKLAVYTAAGGIHPGRVVPVVLDVGTDNLDLLNDPMYLGNRHARVRGEAYDAFVETFVREFARTFPNALLHWEDLGTANARRLLERYRSEVCTFNDDVQGTAATALAAVLSGCRMSGTALRDQRVVLLGPGSAGMGIVEMLCDALVREGLPRAEAVRRFWCVDRDGLLVAGARPMSDVQERFARPAEETGGARPGLAGVVSLVHPTTLIGTSTARGAFTEAVVREMARHVERPVVLPLSNPTALSEAVPADVLRWTDGRALVAAGSPYPAATVGERTYQVAQANNALVFPGIGLGVIVSRASVVTDGMLHAAAAALAGLVDETEPGAPLLPPMNRLRTASATVAVAVVRAAEAEGVARRVVANPVQAVVDAMWQPVYLPLTAG
jgi:malate dehydrogenase (oxaloacetate-decarboxylating)